LSIFAAEALGLTKIYDGVRAVTDLNFAVARGEIFCLVGPDGAGKTTTMRLLCGLLKPTRGQVRILGFDSISQADHVKRRIGYLSQRFTLYGDLTVEENLEFVAEVHDVKDIKSRVERLLAFTRLVPFRRRLAENLSGGMKQKLALAATLVHSPELLLLDEPTTGLDPLSRQEFWKMMFDLLREGLTVVLATPFLDEAERSSRVALLDKGKLLAVDSPAEMKKRFPATAVELICESVSRACGLLRSTKTVLEVQALGDRLVAVVRHPDVDLPAVLHLLKDQGVEVVQWRVIAPSLENVFIFLTRQEKENQPHG